MRKNLIIVLFMLTAGAVKAQTSKLDTSNAAKTVTTAVTATDSKVAADDEIYTTVDQPAEFLGGQEAFITYLYTHVKYPREDMEVRRGGKVFVQFVVEKDGTLGEFKIVKSVSKTIDKEAIRVIKESPRNWTPAKNKGIVVRQLFTVPLAFSTSVEVKN